MYCKNIISRFLLRKNFFRRIKMRLNGEKRKLVKNEFDDLEFLYEKLKTEPKIIFDGGANVGFVSYQFFKKFKNSKIYAFEPNPSVFKTLTTSLKDMKNVILPFNLGISDKKGELEFYKNSNTGTSSFLEPNDFHSSHLARKYTKINVPVISISEFCLENNIPSIDILKLDIEGFELKALQGCEEMLITEKIDFIFAEVNLIPTYSHQCLKEELITYLRTFDYYPYNFYGSHETNFRQSIITNILFISNKTAKKLNAIYGENSVYTK